MQNNAVVEGYQLSPQQARIWLRQQVEGNPRYWAQSAVFMEGEIDVEILKAVISEVVSRHEILRTHFHLLPGMILPLQVIESDQVMSFQEFDLSWHEPHEKNARFEDLFQKATLRCPDFMHTPPAQFHLCRMSASEMILVTSLPAVCVDSRSLKNLFREIACTYGARLRGEEFSGQPVQYADFVEWQKEILEQEDDGGDGADGWNPHFSSVSQPMPGLERESGSSSEYSPDSLSLMLDTETTAEIDRVSSAYHLSPEVFLFACWQVLVWRLTSRKDLTIDYLCEGRRASKLQEAIGAFACFCPIWVHLEPDYTFTERLEIADRLIRTARLHLNHILRQASRAVEDRRLAEQPGAIGFEYEEWPGAESAGAVKFSYWKQRCRIDRFKLKLGGYRKADGLTLEIQYDPLTFSEDSIKLIRERYLTLIENALSKERSLIGNLEIVGRRESERLLITWNETEERPVESPPLHELIAEQAHLRPESIAVIYQEERLSYLELETRANQLANHLRSLGVGPERVVGLYLERATEMMIGWLGILKAGGAYLPLEEGQPAERLETMLEDAGVSVIVTKRELAGSLRACVREVVMLDRDWEEIAGWGREAPESGTTFENLAYVIYTSGSTGRPKGVMVSHGSIVNLMEWLKRTIYAGAGEGLTVGVNASMAFDASVKQLIQLGSGRRICIVPESVRVDVESMLEYLGKQGVEVLDCTPSQQRWLAEAGLGRGKGGPRMVLVGGEAIGERSWKEMSESREARYYNVYGPTECTVDATACEVREGSEATIGRPISNTQIYILDEERRVTPTGMAGEIYIGGAGVARGYVGDAAKTAEKFVPDGFRRGSGGRLYRTGDVGRYLTDGRIVYEGRRDEQVKVRGYRIELGEIAEVLRSHPGVSEAVITVREDEEGQKRLVGYVVEKEESAIAEKPRRQMPKGLREEELRRYVRERVPSYMELAAVVVMEEFRLTRNGKVDRGALPRPEEVKKKLEEEDVGARTAYEEIVRGIWKEVLKVERVSNRENFFEIGGHSLLATQVISRVRSVFGVELGVRSIFEEATVEGLARKVEEQKRAGEVEKAPPLVRASRDGRLPLSYAQQRLWFIDQLEPGNPVYNCPGAVRLTGKLNLEVLERVINEIIRRHEVLRTRINVVEGEPTQIIGEWKPRALPVEDLTSLTLEEKEETVSRLASEDAATGFDLRRGPLLRMKILKLGEEEHVALFTMHHIVSDGWSMGILVEEVKALYEAYCVGEEAPLEELPIQYADFAVWQRSWIRGEVLENQLSYWKRQLAGKLPVLELPTDKPRLAIQTYSMGERSQLLPTMLSDLLKALSLEQSCTLFMTLLSAFNILLYYLTGQTDICIGTTIANRNRAEIQKLIGFFINQLVLRTELSPNSTFKELLGKVREITLGAYAHQDLPFEKLVEALNPKRDANRTPLFQVKIVLQNAPVEELSLPGLKLSPIATTTDTAKFDLLLNLNDTGRGLRASLQYNSDLFEERTPIRILNRFQTLLDRIVQRPDARLQELVESLIEQDEREQEEKKGELKATRRRRLKNINGKATGAPYAEAEQRKDNLSHGAEQIRPITVRRKPFSVVRESLVTIEPQKGEESLPLVMRPSVEGVDLVAWAPSNREFIKAQLLKHGGILFRNFNISSPSAFERFATACSDELLPYREPSSPRTRVRNNIYTSTDYPADQSIFLHNEHSYRHTWPLKIFFFCLEPPAQGGETPIADCRKVFKRVDPKIRRRFIEKGWMLVRNFGDGLSLTWQSVFQTEDKSAVEAYCREAGIETEWREERLRTRQVRQAVARHPSTGEMVWFNHATFFHISTLEPSTREVLLGGLEEEDLPANTYYGDGRPIEHSVLEEIREAYRRETVSFAWQEGDILMLDNMLVAHGRNPYVGRRRILVAMAERFSPIATTLR